MKMRDRDLCKAKRVDDEVIGNIFDKPELLESENI